MVGCIHICIFEEAKSLHDVTTVSFVSTVYFGGEGVHRLYFPGEEDLAIRDCMFYYCRLNDYLQGYALYNVKIYIQHKSTISSGEYIYV